MKYYIKGSIDIDEAFPLGVDVSEIRDGRGNLPTILEQVKRDMEQRIYKKLFNSSLECQNKKTTKLKHCGTCGGYTKNTTGCSVCGKVICDSCIIPSGVCSAIVCNDCLNETLTTIFNKQNISTVNLTEDACTHVSNIIR